MSSRGRAMESSISLGMETKKVEVEEEDEYEGLMGGPPEEVAALLKTLKASLKSRGARGISGLSRKFNIIDDSGNGQLEFDEFKKAMTEHTMGWTDEELMLVFGYFDQDGNGTIDYDEFLVGVRGNLNMRREQMVLMAFDVMDRDKNGFIDLDDIMQIYDASQHPDVLQGKRTKTDILREFLDNFDVGEKDGKVTPAEFCRYYSNVSASIDEDDYFELMIRNAWHISGGEGATANTTCRRVLVTREDGRQTVEEIKDDFGMDPNDKEAMKANLRAQGVDVSAISTSGEVDRPTTAPSRPKPPAPQNTIVKRGQAMQSSIVLGTPVEAKKEEEITLEMATEANPGVPPTTALLLEKMRASLRSRGARGISGLSRKFRIIDDNGNGQLEFDEFKKACREHTFDWSEAEVRELYNFFDADSSGSVDYDEFLVGVRGQLNERRYQMVLLAFGVLDRDKSGIVDMDDIMQIYDASQHPDVIAGKRTRGEIFREFLDTFDVGEKDGKVTPDEFATYYANVSASIDEDDYFELMIRNAWHISGGEGATANTTCRRVLVTHDDGRQTVEEIEDDFGMDKNDVEGMKAKLREQGVDVDSIDLRGGTDQPSEAPKKEKPPAPNNSSSAPPPGRGKANQSTPLW